MNLLRNKNLSTQILILYELHTNNYSKLHPLATKLGITQQAVSEYLHRMKKQNLIYREERQYKPTIQGVALLHQELISLKQFADESVKNLSLITHCIALAAAPIRKGQNVGLRMNDGWLWAHPNQQSSSTGIALSTAEARDYVIIGNLTGIIDHTLGKLYFFELPNPTQSLNHHPSLRQIKQQLQRISIDITACLDPVGFVICTKIGIKPEILYGVSAAILDAAQRGISVAVFGYKETIQETIRSLEKHNDTTFEKISYDIFIFHEKNTSV